MLFSDKRRHSLAVPAVDKDGSPSTVAFLIDHLCHHVMKDTREELFVLDGHLYVPCFVHPPVLSDLRATLLFPSCPPSYPTCTLPLPAPWLAMLFTLPTIPSFSSHLLQPNARGLSSLSPFSPLSLAITGSESAVAV